MTIIAPLLVYWVGSGLLMAVYDATDRQQVWAMEGGGPGARLSDWAVDAAAVPDPATIAPGIARSVRGAGGLAVASVDYRMTVAGPRLQFAEAGGSRKSERRFRAVSGDAMTQEVADGDTGAPPPDYVAKRNALKSWHRGDAAGLGGQVLGLLVGIALLVLTVSGGLIYWKMIRARHRIGRAGLFWQSGDSLWRRLHRWISVVAAVLVLNVAVTGTVLAWGEIQLHLFLRYHVLTPPYPRPTPMPPVSEGPFGMEVAPALARAYAAGMRAAAGAPLVGIDLVRHDGEPKALVTLGGAHPRILAFDAGSGAVVEDWTTAGIQRGQGYFSDWHQVLKRLHRGDILGGFAARYLDIATGLALLYLVVSGVVLYADLRDRRLKARRLGWFWR